MYFLALWFHARWGFGSRSSGLSVQWSIYMKQLGLSVHMVQFPFYYLCEISLLISVSGVSCITFPCNILKGCNTTTAIKKVSLICWGERVELCHGGCLCAVRRSLVSASGRYKFSYCCPVPFVGANYCLWRTVVDCASPGKLWKMLLVVQIPLKGQGS